MIFYFIKARPKLFYRNFSLHIEQQSDNPVSCSLRCMSKCSLRLNFMSQWPHWCGFSRQWVLRCWFSSIFLVNSWEHSWQEKPWQCWTFTRVKKSQCTEELPKTSNRDNVSIKVRNVGGKIMVSSEENCVREEFGSVDTDEYINCWHPSNKSNKTFL